MKNQITIYRILTFILLPFAALFGIVGLFALLIGLANPPMLLPAFIMACFTIYTVVASIFLNRGIDTGNALKPGLKDWIKVNAYVSSVLGIVSLINSVGIFFYSKAQLTQMVTELLESQPVKPQGVTTADFVHILVIVSWVMFFFAVLLLIHLSMSFKLLKQHGHLFGETKE